MNSRGLSSSDPPKIKFQSASPREFTRIKLLRHRNAQPDSGAQKSLCKTSLTNHSSFFECCLKTRVSSRRNAKTVTHIQNYVYSSSICTYTHIHSKFARRTIYTFHSTRALSVRLHLDSNDTLNRNKCVYSATGEF